MPPEGRWVELIDPKAPPSFLACQSPPDFLPRPGRPHPLFTGLIQAASQRLPQSPSEAISQRA